jgi:hypothetical protein
MRSHLPLNPAQIVNLALKPYIALDWIERCRLCEESALVVLQYLFLAEAFCVMGHMPYGKALVSEAQRRLAECFEVATETGEGRLDDETYLVVKDGLAVYFAQLHVIAAADVPAAAAMIKAWRESYNTRTAGKQLTPA